jgi:hypothetical protein
MSVGRLLGLLLLATVLVAQVQAADVPLPSPLLPAETAFIDTMDASNAVDFIDSGYTTTYAGRDRNSWQRELQQRRARLDGALKQVKEASLDPADAAALGALRKSLAGLDALIPSEVTGRSCADASKRDLDYGALRSALVSCFIEIGNQLPFEGRTISRTEARTLLQELDEPARRKAVFVALQPLWAAINGSNTPDSPYRRMMAMAAKDGAAHGSEIDTAARAVGVETPELERWLVRILEAWSEASGTQPVEPWDFTYAASAGSRRLSERIKLADLQSLNDRYYADLGADLVKLKVVYDLAPRADKSSVAYTDFVQRGRMIGSAWRAPLVRVVATYQQGGLGELNELVHESGHAVHVSAIRTRPAYMDWPDSLFCEAFADVPSWSVYEPAWQKRYLGDALSEPDSLRSLYGNVMLDVAWSLFELRMLRNPAADPNVVWTDITRRYLHIVPHPELAWWALRVQLVESPGYMVNYGLGAVLTADMRDRVAKEVGPFDSGNARWYPWLAGNLLRFGTERDTRQLMTGLLGRPVSPDALLAQLRRIRTSQ